MGIQVIDSRRYVFTEILNKKRLTLFTWCVLASCVVIFPIRCDFSDFFHSRPSTLKESRRPNTLNLDSPPNEAKNSSLKYPHGQNSTAESNCKGLTFILTF